MRRVADGAGRDRGYGVGWIVNSPVERSVMV
jgi:hypothetical protein